MSNSKPSSSSNGSRVVHQDYIARVRYSNTLPPPSLPPKLLEIPNTGLSSGHYTGPGFTSRMVREQQPNIEADAELGMPLDLVGMPGVFDGDESSIQAPATTPAIHPRDRPLLRPINSLGAPKPADVAVSFLRRTEYISGTTSKRTFIDNKAGPKRIEKRRAPVEDDDSPAGIRRKIDKSFEFAEAYRKNPSSVKHPENRNLKLVDAFPILPDLDAFPDSGAYVTIKFLTNPVPPSTHYDDRLINGLLKPVETTPSEEAAYHQALELHERDPLNYSKPPPMMNYDFFLTHSATDTKRFRAKFDVNNPENDDDALYSHKSDNGPCFRFERVRGYETAKEIELNHTTKYSEELLVAFTDGKDSESQKAMWYYPVMQRSSIRPQRQRRLDIRRGFTQDDDRQDLDALDVRIEEPPEDMREAMLAFKENPCGEEVGDGDGDAEADAEAEAEYQDKSMADEQRGTREEHNDEVDDE
ncbi:RNA polymerase II-associated protein 1 -like protein [Ceratocystis lukuohia]|uniref:RNA polymerase II-associated protein 1 -like protein n=1 Tax=Ceratocystis lukuohia TaxID=2019550 RepID=A0ABR4ME56_9PEZI